MFGCTNATVGNIVRGSYSPYTENHGRSVYRKNEQVNGLDVLVYFWDDRDGPSFCGWWFGPKVGGDQVWAYSSDRSLVPPSTGWRVPYDGPVDSSFQVSVFSGGAAYNSSSGYGQQQPSYDYGQQQQYDDQGYYQREEDQKRQQQEAERQRQQDEARRQEEMRRQNEQMRQQQQMEELRRREAERRQREDEQRRQQEEEMRRKREEDERRRVEQHAVLMARKAIQRLRVVGPESFEQVKYEVETSLAQELPRCGTQADQIRQESLQAVEQAQQRIQSQLEQQRKDEERRIEEERLRKEYEEKARELLTALGDLVNKAEQDCAKLKETTAPADGETELGVSEAKSVSKAVGEAGAEAKAACLSCTEFIVTNRSAIEQAKSIQAEVRPELLKLQSRIQDGFKLIISMTLRVKAMHDKAVRKAVAAKTKENRSALFDKYDQDNDGMLNKKEVKEYGSGEFSFEVPAEALTRMFKQLANGSGGVPKEKFQRLRMAVGVAREEAASRTRRKEAEERRKRIEARTETLKAELDTTRAALDSGESGIIKSEESASPLGAADLSTIASADLSKTVDDTQEKLDAAKTELTSLRKRIAAFRVEMEDELKPLVQTETQKLEIKANSYDLRLQEVATLVQKGHAALAAQRLAALDKLRTEVATFLKDYIKEKALTMDDFFASVDTDKDNAVSKSEFVAFFEKCGSCPVPKDKLEELFDHIDDEGKGLMQKDSFLSLTRIHYHVVKETVMTTLATIKDGKSVRRLDVDEVIEVQEGPLKDEHVGVTRVKGCAVKDGSVGWITVVGNNGSVFLEEGGCTFVVLQEVPMTAAFEVDGQEPVRTMNKGEKVDVIEWDKKEDATDSVRMKVRLQREGTVGWVTKQTGDNAFLKVLRP